MSVENDATVAAASDATVTEAGGRRAPAEGGIRVGAMLAHFRIDGLLGAGGMGEVYRATDVALDRPVALKVLPGGVAQDPGRRERLIREARAQARVTHPNVCHIYYVGQEDGVVFFAMELVEGETLAERIARGPMKAAEAVELVRQAALGLREAQKQGFTHRDVKPSNLMVDRDGRVRVVDFGLVTRGEGGATAVDQTGMVGTPLYMAPEQAAGDPIDARADIYALGATLHHLVSGKPPFAGDTVVDLASRHANDPRPKLIVPGTRARALSAVDAVIARMMAKRPEDRFASYDELIGELERVSPRTRPAGFFVRAIAAVIDLMVLAIVLAPFDFVLSAFDRELPSEAMMLLLGIGFVTIALSRWGATLGRWLFELEVTTIGTMRRPSLGRALVRSLVQLGPATVVVCLSETRPWTAIGPVDIVFQVLAVLALLWAPLELVRASMFTPDKRAAWDRVAGTAVRYRGRGR